jgi:Fur family transcriptional regulator, zinc uptake regulator
MNVNEALIQLKNNGYKLTDKREVMLSLFANDKRYLSAKEVLNELKMKFPGLSFDTIYRNLSLFAKLKILETTELDGEKKFRFACSVTEHHHHFICLLCGKTKHLSNCPMPSLSIQEEEFEVVDHKFEVYGHCKDCKD